MNRSFCRNFLRYIWFFCLRSLCLYVDLNRCFHIRSCRTAYGNHCFSCCLCGYHTCITDFCDCFITGFIFQIFAVCSIFRSDHCGQFCSFADFQFALVCFYRNSCDWFFHNRFTVYFYCNFCIYIAVFYRNFDLGLTGFNCCYIAFVIYRCYGFIFGCKGKLAFCIIWCDCCTYLCTFFFFQFQCICGNVYTGCFGIDVIVAVIIEIIPQYSLFIICFVSSVIQIIFAQCC